MELYQKIGRGQREKYIACFFISGCRTTESKRKLYSMKLQIQRSYPAIVRCSIYVFAISNSLFHAITFLHADIRCSAATLHSNPRIYHIGGIHVRRNRLFLIPAASINYSPAPLQEYRNYLLDLRV